MEAIKDTIQSVISDLSVRKSAVPEDELARFLKKILTKKEIRHIKVGYFKRGILNVAVDSSAWLYYFSLHKEEILKQLRDRFKTVKDIRFYIGEVK